LTLQFYWYVCNGKVEEYKNQQPDWKNSVIVRAKTPGDALLNVMKYHSGTLERIEVIHEGKNIQVIS
jgi:ribosomal protein L19